MFKHKLRINWNFDLYVAKKKKEKRKHYFPNLSRWKCESLNRYFTFGVNLAPSSKNNRKYISLGKYIPFSMADLIRSHMHD